MSKLTNAQVKEKIAQLDQIRDELLSQAQPADGIRALEDAQQRVEFGSKEHEALLAVGYGMDKTKAQAIIKERKANPAAWPYEMLEKAQAFLEALSTKPIVIATRPAWRRRHHSRILNAAV